MMFYDKQIYCFSLLELSLLNNHKKSIDLQGYEIFKG